jgi:hypothetical protein
LAALEHNAQAAKNQSVLDVRVLRKKAVKDSPRRKTLTKTTTGA